MIGATIYRSRIESIFFICLDYVHHTYTKPFSLKTDALATREASFHLQRPAGVKIYEAFKWL